MELPIDTCIEWMGFSTTVGELLHKGWEFSHKPAYTRLYLESTKKSVPYMYLRLPSHGLIARISLDRVGVKQNYTLDFLKHEKVKSKDRMYRVRYTEDDIIHLLEEIKKLQGIEYKEEIASGDVIELSEYFINNRLRSSIG